MIIERDLLKIFLHYHSFFEDKIFDILEILIKTKNIPDEEYNEYTFNKRDYLKKEEISYRNMTDFEKKLFSIYPLSDIKFINLPLFEDNDDKLCECKTWRFDNVESLTKHLKKNERGWLIYECKKIDDVIQVRMIKKDDNVNI